jgi:hypothetical protein
MASAIVHWLVVIVWVSFVYHCEHDPCGTGPSFFVRLTGFSDLAGSEIYALIHLKQPQRVAGDMGG